VTARWDRPHLRRTISYHYGVPLCDWRLQIQSFTCHCHYLHPNNDEPELSDLLYTLRSAEPAGTELCTYWNSNDRVDCKIACTVKGCQAMPDQLAGLQRQFGIVHCHQDLKVKVFNCRDSGQPIHKRFPYACPSCNLCYANPISARHQATKLCRDVSMTCAKEK
jgi:hypothetical protein